VSLSTALLYANFALCNLCALEHAECIIIDVQYYNATKGKTILHGRLADVSDRGGIWYPGLFDSDLTRVLWCQILDYMNADGATMIMNKYLEEIMLLLQKVQHRILKFCLIHRVSDLHINIYTLSPLDRAKHKLIISEN
jgi:hypothetical protein